MFLFFAFIEDKLAALFVFLVETLLLYFCSQTLSRTGLGFFTLLRKSFFVAKMFLKEKFVKIDQSNCFIFSLCRKITDFFGNLSLHRFYGH